MDVSKTRDIYIYRFPSFLRFVFFFSDFCRTCETKALRLQVLPTIFTQKCSQISAIQNVNSLLSAAGAAPSIFFEILQSQCLTRI